MAYHLCVGSTDPKPQKWTAIGVVDDAELDGGARRVFFTFPLPLQLNVKSALRLIPTEFHVHWQNGVPVECVNIQCTLGSQPLPYKAQCPQPQCGRLHTGATVQEAQTAAEQCDHAHETWPQECFLCHKPMESEDDRMQWHGLGNCVGVCAECHGTGQASEKQVQDATVMVQAIEEAKRMSQVAALLWVCKELCGYCAKNNAAQLVGGQWCHILQGHIEGGVGRALCSADKLRGKLVELQREGAVLLP